MLIRLYPVSDFFDRFALFFKVCGEVDKKPLAKRGAKGVDGINLSVGVFRR